MDSVILTVGKHEKPYDNLSAAMTAALSEMKKGASVTVSFDGIRRIASPLILDGKGVPADASLTLKGGDHAVMTSVTDIPGEKFAKTTNENVYAYTLPETAKDRDGKYPAFRNIYFDETQMRLCRCEKDYTMFMDSCRRAPNNGLVTDDETLYIHKELLVDVKRDENGKVIGDLEFWIKTEWQIHCVHIESYTIPEVAFRDAAGAELWPVRVRSSDWKFFINAYYNRLDGYPYFLANNEAYLRQNGDFFYNRDSGTIYVYSDTPLRGHTVSYPLAERLIFVHDFCNLTVENITFYGVTCNYITENGYITGQGGRIKRPDPETGLPVGFLRLAAIYGENVRNVEIKNCVFHDVGNDAVNFRCAVDNVNIHHCRFENIGGSAVRIGQNTPEFSEAVHAKNITVTENYICKTGQVFSSNTGILIASVENLELTYNTILESFYSAISVGWSWASHEEGDPAEFDNGTFVNIKNANIAYNYIEDFMTGMKDGGAIYVLGGNASGDYLPYLNSMNHNYVVVKSNVARGTDQWTVLYHDSGSSHWDDYNNVLVVEKNMRVPLFTYVSYQAYAQCYRCRTRDMYIVGYPQDHFDDEELPLDYTDRTNDTRVGWAIANGHRTLPREQLLTYRAEVDEKTSAYSTTSKCFADHHIEIKNVYLYRGFDDPHIGDKAAFLREVAEKAGCAFRHPIPEKQPENM